MQKLRSLARRIVLSFRVVFGSVDGADESRARCRRLYVLVWLLALMLPSVLGIGANRLYAYFIDRLGVLPLSLVLLGAVLLVRIGGGVFAQLKTVVFERLARDADRRMSIYTIGRIANLQQLDFDCADRFDRVKPVVKSELSLWNLNWQLIELGSALVSVVGTLSIALRYRSVLVLAALLLAVPVIVLEILMAQQEENFRTDTRSRGHATAYYEKMLLDPVRMKELKLFGESAQMRARWHRAFLDNRRAVLGYARKKHGLTLLCVLCRLAFLLIISLTCAFDCSADRLTLGDYSLHTANFALMFGALEELAAALHAMLTTDSELAQFTQFTEATAHGERQGGALTVTDELEIRFEQVCFSYGTREVLHNVSFSWRRGERIALIGRNGSGKSTLIKLLCGLYTPTSGRILINGVSSEAYAQNALYRLFGVVYQDFCHYALSMRENVAVQRIEDRQHDAAITEALARAGLAALMLPNGLDTALGRRFDPAGIELSGGQWQKVAISRSLFGGRPLRLYDEPASALDSVSENAFLAHALSDSDCGILVISHRLSIGKMVDRILLLEKGEIVESGSHDALMRAGGRYAEMFLTQASLYGEGDGDEEA